MHIHVTMKHQSISKWLSQLGLPQYCLALEQEYDGVEVKIYIHSQMLLFACWYRWESSALSKLSAMQNEGRLTLLKSLPIMTTISSSMVRSYLVKAAELLSSLHHFSTGHFFHC